MLDLETMGIGPKAAIAAIGAVKFDPRAEPGKLIDSFYTNVDLQSSIDAGLVCDGATIMWWLEQSAEARAALKAPDPLPLAQTLSQFNEFVGADRPLVWGNGMLDCVALRSAYSAFHEYPPFGFRDEMDYRTFRKQLPEIEFLPPVIKHHALHDAEAQAVHLQMLFNKFMPKEG